MKVDIYIRGMQLDIHDGESYTLTKQVNDFTELRTRQWSHTEKLKLPKSGKNKRIFDFLGVAANTSESAYVRLGGAQMHFNGIAIVRDGYAMVNETDEDYNIVIYEGSVTFFEAIKNLTLRDLDWSDLDHDYNAGTMEESWVDTDGYIYPVANVIPGQQTDFALFDMPSPAVFLPDIITKIATISGISIEGSLLNDPQYLNTVITTKRTIKLSKEKAGSVFTDSKFSNIGNVFEYTEPLPADVTVPMGFTKILLKWDYTTTQGTVPIAEIKVDGTVRHRVRLLEAQGEQYIYSYGSNFKGIFYAYNPVKGIYTDITLTIGVSVIDFQFQEVFFSEIMPDTSLHVFLKNIFTHFGVNIYPNVKENKVRFDFINDLNDEDPIDISKYFQSDEGENYQLGAYESENIFQYITEEEQDAVGDGILRYRNNKGESKPHFTSIFSEPILENVDYLKYQDIHFDEKGEPTDANFKIMSIQTIEKPITLSYFEGTFGKVVPTYTAYDFEPFKFSNLLPKYYSFISNRIFNRPIARKVKLAIPLVRFYFLDFTKLYYLRMYNEDFMINKLTLANDGITRAELITVNKNRYPVTDPVAVIDGKTVFISDKDEVVNLDGRGSFYNNGYIKSYYWEQKDSAGTVLSTGTKPYFQFNAVQDTGYEVCLTVTSNDDTTNTVCKPVTNANVPVQPFIINQRFVDSDRCYTFYEITVQGDEDGEANMTVGLNVSSGFGRVRVMLPYLSGINCKTNACARIGLLTGTSSKSFRLFLNAGGTSIVQFEIQGARLTWANAPPCELTITIKNDDTGVVETIYKRLWSKTDICPEAGKPEIE